MSINIEVSSGFGVFFILFCFGVFHFRLVLVVLVFVGAFLLIASFAHRGDKGTKKLTEKATIILH